MTGAKRLHRLYTDELQRRLATRGFCSRLEYTGSVYEGVKVRRNSNDSDLEFDIMVILPRETDLQVYKSVASRSITPQLSLCDPFSNFLMLSPRFYLVIRKFAISSIVSE